jgi:hypothetical protein
MSYYAYPPGGPASAPSSAQPSGQPAAAYQPMMQPGGQPAGPHPGMMPPSSVHNGYYAAYQPAALSPQGAGMAAGRGYPTPAAQPFFNLGDDRFLKGLLIGAAAAYLLTNESVQRTAIKGAVKLWGGLQGGVEEIKERFHDAEAELQASDSHKGD